jgi:hypothetical protein
VARYAPQNGIDAGSTTNQLDTGVQEYAIDQHCSNGFQKDSPSAVESDPKCDRLWKPRSIFDVLKDAS